MANRTEKGLYNRVIKFIKFIGLYPYQPSGQLAPLLLFIAALGKPITLLLIASLKLFHKLFLLITPTLHTFPPKFTHLLLQTRKRYQRQKRLGRALKTFTTTHPRKLRWQSAIYLLIKSFSSRFRNFKLRTLNHFSRLLSATNKSPLTSPHQTFSTQLSIQKTLVSKLFHSGKSHGHLLGRRARSNLQHHLSHLTNIFRHRLNIFLVSSAIHFQQILFRLKQSLALTKPSIHRGTYQLVRRSKPVFSKIKRLFSQTTIRTNKILQTSHRTLHKRRSINWRHATIAVFLSLLANASYLFYTQIIKDLPNPTDLATTTPSLTTKIYDRNGQLLYKIFKSENRSLVSLDQIPTSLQLATIAIEDQDFYSHSGFSLKGIARALKATVLDHNLQGGSTITQQLIKNTLLSRERTVTRKTKELILSVLTEFYFTKEEILTMYFNQVPYGGETYGIREASQMYFGKDVTELDLAEAAFLAGLPAAPTRFSPYGTNPELARARQLQVLRRMVEDGFVSAQEAQTAAATPLEVKPQKNSILAPHFVMYVKNYLVERYGLALVEKGGLEVTTTLDLSTQNLAQQIVTSEINQLTPLNVTNGAALITTPRTGEILAMVGSVDYFDTASDGQVNVTLRPRQPGSSIKPINYAVALESGFTPATIIPDTPICYHLPYQEPYCPKNYDGRFHGQVTLRTALASSYNIPAVKTLYQFGVDSMIQKGQALGITTWDDPNRFGLALTLGGGEVKMVDMAVAYGTFANSGARVDLNPILKIKDSEGKILETHPCVTSDDPDSQGFNHLNCFHHQALDPRVAYQITDILSDNQARSQAFGTNSVLNIKGQQVAVKTGTTNSLRDNWTVGYTPDYLVAAWVGNNDNSPMSRIASGITGASPIWAKIITQLTKDQELHAFTPPANLTKVKVCALTGTLACNGCPSKEEYFIPGTEPKNHCSSEHIAKILSPDQPPDQPHN